MKSIITNVFNFVFCFFVSTCVLSQNQEIIINRDNLNKSVLTTLFNGNYEEEINVIVWHPNPKESFLVGNSGETCTKVDTVFTFSIEKEKYSLFVFNSMPIDSGVIQDANAVVPTMSLALFKIKQDSLSLIAFNRNVCQVGHMGFLGKLNIEQVGSNKFAISVEEEDYKETDIFTTFYSLNEGEFGKEIFSCPIWKIISYSETPIYQKSIVKIKRPKSGDIEFYDILVSSTQEKEPSQTVIKRSEEIYKYNGRRWEKK